MILRGVLSGPELAAARAAFERTLATATVPPPGGTRDPTTGPARSNIDGTPIREPDLERLVRPITTIEQDIVWFPSLSLICPD